MQRKLQCSVYLAIIDKSCHLLMVVIGNGTTERVMFSVKWNSETNRVAPA